MAGEEFTVTLEGAYGTIYEQKVRADSAESAFTKAVEASPGQGNPTAKYAEDSDGVRHRAE